MLKIALATLVIALLIVIFFRREPEIYFIGPADAPLVTVIAGVHGNEPAPARYLEELAHRLRDEDLPPGVRFALVPRANPAALLLGVRDTGVDMNRVWGTNRMNHSVLQRLVDRSRLVIDMHEAWGFERADPGSLGQTAYASDARLVSLVDQTVAALNERLEPRHHWQRLARLPELDGTSLDMYCADKKVPYILLEFAGQHDIMPVEVRRAECALALQSLLGLR